MLNLPVTQRVRNYRYTYLYLYCTWWLLNYIVHVVAIIERHFFSSMGICGFFLDGKNVQCIVYVSEINKRIRLDSLNQIPIIQLEAE